MHKLLAVTLVALLTHIVPQPCRADERPNIILIVADDLGARDLGCCGSTFYRTPNLDRMAQDGLRFTAFYAACPVCSPTRASIMTGRYPTRFALTDWLPGRPDRPEYRLNRPKLTQQLPLEERTLAELLKDAGYVTGHIGKWHLGGAGFGPLEQGFMSNIAGDHFGTPRSYFAPYTNKTGTIPGLEKAPEGEYLTDRLAAEAAKFIRANADKPFFLYLPHFAPHTPLRAKKETIAKYPNQPKASSQSNPIYAAMVESLDDSVGVVLQTLDELKLSEKTLVIFTSDNGGLATNEAGPTGATFNAPYREGKGFLYEGGIRVPCIVKWPRVVKPGTTTDVRGCSIDFLPTILEATDTKLPTDRPIDGISLLPVLRGGVLRERRLFWHYPHYANQGSRPAGAIIDGDYKLIEYYEDGRLELFHLSKDVSESRNLAVDQPEVTAKLAEQLKAWRQEVGALLPTPNPGYIPNPQAKDGTVTMHGKSARVYGVQLRYEPLPHKETLGFWTNAKDYVEFEFTLMKGGQFRLDALQGCGAKSGGSEVEFKVGEQALSYTVKETGGFQKFEQHPVGILTLEKPGRYTLSVRAKTKPGVAVMDLRQLTLTPIE